MDESKTDIVVTTSETIARSALLKLSATLSTYNFAGCGSDFIQSSVTWRSLSVP